MRKLMTLWIVGICLLPNVAFSALDHGGSQSPVPFEVWALDQANVGAMNAGRLYVYHGMSMNGRSLMSAPEIIDLGEAATGACVHR